MPLSRLRRPCVIAGAVGPSAGSTLASADKAAARHDCDPPTMAEGPIET
jgi:hypothetical protein